MKEKFSPLLLCQIGQKTIHDKMEKLEWGEDNLLVDNRSSEMGNCLF